MTIHGYGVHIAPLQIFKGWELKLVEPLCSAAPDSIDRLGWQTSMVPICWYDDIGDLLSMAESFLHLKLSEAKSIRCRNLDRTEDTSEL